MLLGGDERCRTQGGNNNAWCQDNEISWYDWNDDDCARAMLEWTRRLIELRREHPVFRRKLHLSGESKAGSGLPDVWWFRSDGRKMTRADWQSGKNVVGMFLNGSELVAPGPQRRAHRGRLVPALLQRPPRGLRLPGAQPALRAALDA